MKIICIKGGLGNQLFEYCRYRQLEDKHKWLYYDYRRMKEHGGIMLQKCFDIELSQSPFYIYILVWFIKLLDLLHILAWFYDIDSEKSILIDDYCQNKAYITDAKKYLHFRNNDYGEEWKQYANHIKNTEHAVSIHIRRGDYLHPKNINNFGTCSIEYYKRAVQLIRKENPHAFLFIFSDDIEWTKKNIQFEHATYIELPHQVPDYAELRLMTFCKSHIIANSTFSFWGAYLAETTQDTINIYPKEWFKNNDWNTPDIFSDNWINL